MRSALAMLRRGEMKHHLIIYQSLFGIGVRVMHARAMSIILRDINQQ